MSQSLELAVAVVSEFSEIRWVGEKEPEPGGVAGLLGEVASAGILDRPETFTPAPNPWFQVRYIARAAAPAATVRATRAALLSPLRDQSLAEAAENARIRARLRDASGWREFDYATRGSEELEVGLRSERTEGLASQAVRQWLVDERLALDGAFLTLLRAVPPGIS